MSTPTPEQPNIVTATEHASLLPGPPGWVREDFVGYRLTIMAWLKGGLGNRGDRGPFTVVMVEEDESAPCEVTMREVTLVQRRYRWRNPWPSDPTDVWIACAPGEDRMNVIAVGYPVGWDAERRVVTQRVERTCLEDAAGGPESIIRIVATRAIRQLGTVRDGDEVRIRIVGGDVW